MFVPGLGVAAAAYKAYRVVSTAYKIAKVAKAAGNLAKFGKVSKLTSNLAGRMYTGKYWGSSKRLMSRDGLRGYRAPTLKKTGPLKGQYASNFEKYRQRPHGSVNNRSYKYPNRYYDGHLLRR